jgi:hypothetical protein
MASRKDYEDVAQRLARLPLADSDREVVAAELAQHFGASNSRFDADRFMEACRPDGSLGAVDPSTLTRILIDYLLATFQGEGKLPTLESIVDVARDSALSTERLAGTEEES